MTEREALKLALKFIESNADSDWERELVADIKEALAQPALASEQRSVSDVEPVAWLREDEMKAMTSLEKDAWVKSGRTDLVKDYNKPLGYLSEGDAERLLTKKQAIEHIKNFKLFAHDVPVYTTPPQRTWVGLTDEEIVQCQQGDIYHFYRCIEAKLKEKNT